MSPNTPKTIVTLYHKVVNVANLYWLTGAAEKIHSTAPRRQPREPLRRTRRLPPSSSSHTLPPPSAVHAVCSHPPRSQAAPHSARHCAATPRCSTSTSCTTRCRRRSRSGCAPPGSRRAVEASVSICDVAFHFREAEEAICFSFPMARVSVY